MCGCEERQELQEEVAGGEELEQGKEEEEEEMMMMEMEMMVMFKKEGRGAGREGREGRRKVFRGGRMRKTNKEGERT